MSRRTKSSIIAASVLAAVVVAVLMWTHAEGLPSDIEDMLIRAETFDLLSLDPDALRDRERTKATDKDQFHHFLFLGEASIISTPTREVIVSARDRGIATSDGSVAACVNPRHGIRAIHNGRTIDVVICFECMSLVVFVDGTKRPSLLTTGAPSPCLTTHCAGRVSN